MRLARFAPEAGYEWGAVTEDGVVELTELVRAGHGAIHALLGDDGRKRTADFVAGRAADHAYDEELLAPFLPDPGKIICVGVNYPDRNAEYRDGSDAPSFPSLFIRVPESFTAHGKPLLRPRESNQLDYEGEIAVVIGKGGRRIARSDALAHLAGATLVNEGTVRDWVRHAKFNVTQGKNFDASGAVGPWMVTRETLGDLGALSIETRVNGEVRQADTVANMIFPIDFLIEYVSSFTTLRPGDLISTGTPTGAGARLDPPQFLKPGDMVEVSAPGIGCLRNGVADG